MDVLTILLVILFTVISTVTIWLNLPGSFIMAAFIFVWAWMTGFALMSLNALLFILFIVVVLEILEFALGGFATRVGGGEKRSAFLAVVGGLLGTIVLGSVFFVIGALIGLFLGSFLGAYWGELQAGKTRAEAKRAAMATLLGNIAAKVLKTAAVIVIGVWMIRELV